jgi:thiamine pyridinylase
VLKKVPFGLSPLAITLSLFLFLTPAICAQPITLRVALYPYVPDKYAVFALLAREFQEQNEGVTLDLIEPVKEYYDGGLLGLDADVYEIDTILLSDMIAAKKLAPVNVSLNGFAPEAVEAVTRDGTIYAVPHWLCGNFLFYRKGDSTIENARTWQELVDGLKKQNKPLMFDFFGRLTLGEFYITMLADRVGIQAAQDQIKASPIPNSQTVSDLNLALSACPSGYCRSNDFHNRTGFYARAFVRGEAHAYIGYSESIHYGLQDVIDACHSDCLSQNDIAVRRLPTLGQDSSKGIGWVDGLGISRDLADRKKDLALKFINYITSPKAYEIVLTPQFMEAPRYLLPARVGAPPDVSIAPLYPAFLAAHAGRTTGTAPELNGHLRTLAGNLNCALPIDRTDTTSRDKCQKQ